MASGGAKVWAISQPSAAFVLKCAKEQEKLRVKLQKQLQDHMLQLLEESLFPDILIAVNDNKQHLNLSEEFSNVVDSVNPYNVSIVKAHKAILKVRVPSLYNELCKQEVKSDEGTTFRSYIGKTHLLSLLRKVYTEDDIRKSECEAVRLGKILSEQLKAEENRLLELASLKDDADKVSNGELFVTPTTSPLSPKKEKDISHMFQKHELLFSESQMEKFELEEVTKLKDMTNNIEIKTVNENNNSVIYRIESNDKNNAKNFLLPLDDQNCLKQCNNLNANKNSSSMDDNTPADNSSDSPSSGMVRSGTFDLQAQLPLEETLDSQQWNSHESEIQPSLKMSKDENILTEESCCSKKHDALKSFFLHRNPQLLKGEYFQDTTHTERMKNFEQDNTPGTNSPGKRLDVSVMSDSGFMSQSTFSLISETGLQCSLSSSLVTSCDDTLSSSLGSKKESDELVNKEYKNYQRSSSMFPFYIDIDNLTPDAANPKLPQQTSNQRAQSVYMYIDASHPKNYKEQMTKAAIQSDFHKENYSPYFQERNNESVITKELYNKLVKVHSFPQLSKSSDKNFSQQNRFENYIKNRPQSCYMFIDLESLETEIDQSDNNFPKKENSNKSSSISMYIDLKDNISESVESAQQKYNERKMSDKNSKLNKIDTREKYLTDLNSLSQHTKSSTNIVITDNKVDNTECQEILLNTDTNKQNFSICENSYIEKAIGEITSKIKDSAIPTDMNSKICITDSLDSSKVGVVNNEILCHEEGIQKPLKPAVVDKIDKVESEAIKKMHQEKKADKQISVKKTESPSKNLKNQTNTEVYTKKENTVIEQDGGLLPMSPILRRKEPKKEPVKPQPQPVTIKASTRPQDVDAMTFRRSDKENEDDSLQSKKFQETDELLSSNKFSSPHKVPKPPPQVKQVTNVNVTDTIKSSGQMKQTTNASIIDSTKLDIDISKQNVGGSETIAAQQKPISQTDLTESVTSSVESSILSSDKQITSDILKDKQLFSPPSWSYEIDDDSETIYSEVSDVSSSFLGMSCSSGQGKKSSKEGQSPDTENVLGGTYRRFQACSKLGEDLLKMFLEEINTDIIIQVQEKEIKAHRCILVARCKYFAAMFKGSWFESAGSTINLQGFSYEAVHFALCHIYSGAINLPQDINIAEIALLADMLQLDTLKEVIVFHLKMNYCHFFHRPCSQCIQGVIECLHLAASCSLNELYEKCIRWLGKYFTRTWPNKCFAALPEEVREECYQNTLPNLNVNNLVETTLCCDRLMATLSHVKWTEPIYEMVTRLLQDCIYYMALHFDQMLTSDGFLALGKGQSWNVTSFEDSISSAVEILTPDIACKSYVKISEILPAAELENRQELGKWTQNFIDLLHRIQRQCERFLIHNANHVVHCQSWALLSPEVQKRIKDAAIIVFEFEKPTAPPPRLSSLHRKMKKQKDGEELPVEEKYSTYPKKTKSVRGRKICRRGPDQVRPRSISHDEQLEREMNQTNIIEEDKKSKASGIKDSQVKTFQKPRRSVSTEAVVRHVATPGTQKTRLVCSASEENMFSSQKKMCQKVPTFSRVISDDLSKLKTLEDEDSMLFKLENTKDNKNKHEKISLSLGQIDNVHPIEIKQCTCTSEARIVPNSFQITRNVASTEKNMKTFPYNTTKSYSGAENSKYNNDIKLDNSNSHVPLHIPTTVKNSQVAKVPPFTVKNDCKSPSSCYEGYSSHTMPYDKNTIDVLSSPINENHRDQNGSQKDLVAEIDADSSLVSHCLQEAEILEQELSRKLQRQQQAVSTTIASTPIIGCASPKLSAPNRSRLTGLHKPSVQKPSGVPFRERSQSSGSVRSSGSISTHTVSGKCTPKNESYRDQRNVSNRPSLPRPISSNQRQFCSMESVVSHSRQTASHVSTQTRYTPSRSVKNKSPSVPRKGELRYTGPDGNKQ